MHQHTIRMTVVLGLALVITLAFFTLVSATPGDLDTSFDGDGIAATSIDTGPVVFEAVAVQSDGKVVGVGKDYEGTGWNPPSNALIVRYNVDGSLDSSFAVNGVYTSGLSGVDDYYNGVAIQPDSKIIAVGLIMNGFYEDILVVRHNADGSLDTGFGTGGKAIIPIGSGSDIAHAVVLQPDGKIIVSGESEESPGTLTYDMAVLRFHTNGTLDTSFNSVGYTVVPIRANQRDRAYNVDVQADGKIVATGESETGYFSNKYDTAIIRLDTNGTLDSSFNSTGIVTTSFNTSFNICGKGVAVQKDGKILVAGSVKPSPGSNIQVGVVRYDTDGSEDIRFNLVSFPSTAIVQGMTMQADGKIIVTGYVSDATYVYDPFVVRYNVDGTPDTTFSGDGKLITVIGTDADYGLDVAMAPDGKIVIAGYKSSAGIAAIAVRYDTQVVGSASVGSSLTPIGDIGVSAQLVSGSCNITVTKSIAYPNIGGYAHPLPITWDVSTDCQSPYDMSLSFCYSDDELANAAASVVEASLSVFRYASGLWWNDLGGSVNPAINCVTLGGVTDIDANGSRFSLGEAVALPPVFMLPLLMR
jgi:uncharacterized delta-60 repeat protein